MYDAPVTQHLIELSKKANIPLVTHNNTKSWLLGSNKWHNQNIKNFASDKDIADYIQDRYDDSRVSEYDIRDIDALQELLTKNNEEDLSKTGKELLDKLYRYPDSWVSSFSNLIHNNKNKPTITGPVSKIFKQYNVKNFKQLEKILYDKWE